MKTLKIVAAVILTIALLYVARNNSRGRPEFVTHTENGFTFEYTTVPKGLEHTKVSIPITVRGDFTGDQLPAYLWANPKWGKALPLKAFFPVPMVPDDTLKDCYRMNITTLGRGGRLYYYFAVTDYSHQYYATFTQDNGTPFELKYIGEVPGLIVLGHIALIFATVFFISLGAVNAISLIRGGTDIKPMARYFLLAAVCAFLGGYPFGFAMNWYAFDTIWEGVPFGTDATDNKTQILFLYILFMVLASLGSLKDGKYGRNVYSPRTLGWFGIAAFPFMLAIYLIPHSIQFSPELTYAVCYSFIALMAALYIIGFFKSRSKIDVE